MKGVWGILGLVGLVGLLVLSGCDSGYVEPSEPDWATCSMWEICEIQQRNVVNSSIEWCRVMDASNAEWVYHFGRRQGASMTIDCTTKGGVVVSQVPLGN